MGASHPVPDKWEPFQDQFSDSAPEVPPTFLTCTTARLVRRHQAFQFVEPVEDDVDLGSYFRFLNHQEALSVWG